MKRALSILLLSGFAAAISLRAAEIRFEDVFYLDEVHAKPLPLKTTKRVKLTVSRDQSTPLAILEPADTVWVLGFAEDRLYVETQITSGKAKGWVDESALEKVPEEIRADIEERIGTARRHKELIAKRQIDFGMTRKQVEAALGKPDERTRTQEGETVEEQWMYRTYKNIPQRDYYYVDGKLYERAYYKKVFAGGKTVTFRNDEVTAIKDEEKVPETTASTPVIVAPPPLIYHY